MFYFFHVRPVIVSKDYGASPKTTREAERGSFVAFAIPNYPLSELLSEASCKWPDKIAFSCNLRDLP